MNTSKQMIFEIAYFIKSVSKMEMDDCVNHAKKICEELTCMGDSQKEEKLLEIKNSIDQFKFSLALTGSEKVSSFHLYSLKIGKIQLMPKQKNML